MSRISSWASWKLKSVLEQIRHRRFQSSNDLFLPKRPTMIVAKLENDCWIHPGLKFFSSNGKTKTDLYMAKDLKVQTPVPATSKFNFANWVKWTVGCILSVLLPFWKEEWAKFQRIEGKKYKEKSVDVSGEAEVIVEEVENVVKVVEKVTSVAEKVSADVADNLPENSKLKKAALLVEHVSEETANDAQLTEEFIRKVDALKNDLENLGTFVEPVIDKIVKKES